jgi:hypothetical protein
MPKHMHVPAHYHDFDSYFLKLYGTPIISMRGRKKKLKFLDFKIRSIPEACEHEIWTIASSFLFLSFQKHKGEIHSAATNFNTV